jgi:hypothetical protein
MPLKPPMDIPVGMLGIISWLREGCITPGWL